MQYTFMLTLKDGNSGFYAKSPEYARLHITGEQQENASERRSETGATLCPGKELRSGKQQPEATYRILAAGFDFAQGATLDAQGNLYWCDKADKRIYKYDRKKEQAMPFLDIHFTPAALSVDTAGNLLVAVDYSELKKTVPGQPFQTHDTENYHPFFSWFYKRGEKAYAVSLENPYDTMRELKKVSAKDWQPQILYRPAELDYPGMFAREAERKVEEYYPAPDGKCALQGTIDLGRSLCLAPAVEGKDFLLTDDAGHCAYAYRVTAGGNLQGAVKIAARGQYGAAVDRDGKVWTVEDRLYGFSGGELTDNLPVPEDAHSVICDGENLYIIGRNRIYCRECDRKGEM